MTALHPTPRHPPAPLRRLPNMGAHRETPSPLLLPPLLPRRHKRSAPTLPAPRAAIPLLPAPRHPEHAGIPPPHPSPDEPQPVQAPHSSEEVVADYGSVFPAPHTPQHRLVG